MDWCGKATTKKLRCDFYAKRKVLQAIEVLQSGILNLEKPYPIRTSIKVNDTSPANFSNRSEN